MKKVFLMTSLLAGLGLATMAQTSPAPAAKKEHKKEAHQKSDSTSKASHEKKAAKKTKSNK